METQDNLPTQRVVGYVRASTKEQVLTLEAQPQQITRYCEIQQLELVGIFTDKGIKGSSRFYERPSVIEMMAFMKANHCTGVVIAKLDRGFRNTLDCLFTAKDFKDKGISLHLLDLGVVANTPVGELQLGLMAMLAQFENRRRAERQQDTFAVMRPAYFRCGTIPYGWQAITSTRKSSSGLHQAQDLVPHNEEYATLLWILRRHEQGASDNQIARELNTQGVPAKRGGKWFGATVQSVREHALLSKDHETEVAA